MSLALDTLFTQTECQTTLLCSAERDLCNFVNETAVLGQCVQKHHSVLQLKESS